MKNQIIKSVPRHELWRRFYRAKRYCRHLSEAELSQRIRDISLNLLRLTPDALIGLRKLDKEGKRALELWTHVLEEMAIRDGGPYRGFAPAVLNSEPFPDLAGELGRKAAGVLAARHLKSDDVFIKFGKVDHMRSLLERGALRVQPASYYAESDHNGAIRDDELSCLFHLHCRAKTYSK